MLTATNNNTNASLPTTFGRWVVLSSLDANHLLCRCECGNERPVLIASLRSGRSKSCGCTTDNSPPNGMQPEGSVYSGGRSANGLLSILLLAVAMQELLNGCVDANVAHCVPWLAQNSPREPLVLVDADESQIFKDRSSANSRSLNLWAKTKPQASYGKYAALAEWRRRLLASSSPEHVDL
jgi:hypothetical protein